jgi:calcium-binding protein CML
MKLTINPKKLFGSKKTRSVSKTDQSSFGSGTDTSSSSVEAWETTPTSVFDLEHAFKAIDINGDGVITVAELEALFSRICGGAAPSQDEILVMVNELDRDGDGCISLEEFGAIGSAFLPPSGEEELRETFEFFDEDKDGRITAEELLRVFKAFGDGRCTLEDCRRMISGVDKNGDGFVCFEDFTLMMDLQR